MTLVPFTEQDFDLLIGWIKSDTQNYLWGGPTYTYPLDKKQLGEHCSKSQVSPYLFYYHGEAVGFIELYKVSKRHYRICRVLIAEQYRGKGLSKEMLNRVIDEAQNELGAYKVSLGVFEKNSVAQRCYETLGFKVVSIDRTSRTFNGETWALVRMEKSLILRRLKSVLKA